MLHPGPELRLSPYFLLALGTCLFGQVACILPRDPATGIELRWRLPEANLADAPAVAAGDRLRTCSGARVARVRAELQDHDAPERRRSFDYDCDAGDASPADRVREPAAIFIDLRPGNYDLDLRWHDDAGHELGQLQETVQVEPDTLVPLDLALVSPLLPWTLDLRGTAACSELSLEIFYDDPTLDLHELPETADGRYRSELVSDAGLRLTDPPIACAELVDGPQRFRDLDRGAYRLRLNVDGQDCELGFLVDAAAPPLSVDLAKPGCAG
ncbi:hypothetical protein [Nannocystis sp.]|uniref:hypothetical protein n=1 Tax=Nannocystis sp. TaxID=1962667 RepID=UPI0025EE53F7|nr:hypothetical protein [Nannocystis sp.]MBK7827866.1 hypothetical protein [Nannocystis sp.]